MEFVESLTKLQLLWIRQINTFVTVVFLILQSRYCISYSGNAFILKIISKYTSMIIKQFSWKKSKACVRRNADTLCNILQCSVHVTWNKRCVKRMLKDLIKLTARDSICYKAGIARQKWESEKKGFEFSVTTCSPPTHAISTAKRWRHFRGMHEQEEKE